MVSLNMYHLSPISDSNSQQRVRYPILNRHQCYWNPVDPQIISNRDDSAAFWRCYCKRLIAVPDILDGEPALGEVTDYSKHTLGNVTHSGDAA